MNKIAIMAIMCFVAMAANAQEIKRDTVCVNGERYVFITDTLSNFQITELLQVEDSLAVLVGKTTKSDTVVYVYDSFVKREDGLYLAFRSNVLNVKKAENQNHTSLPLNSSWKRQKPMGMSDSLYIEGLKSQNIAKKNSDKDRDVYEAVYKGMPFELYAINRYGWEIAPYVGFQMSKSLNSLAFGAELRFTQRWGYLSAQAEYGKSKFPEVSRNPGKEYGTLRTEFRVGKKLFTWDLFDTNRIMITAGLGFEYYGTDSPAHDGGFIRSWGNYLYPTVGIQYDKMFFASKYGISFLLQWRGLNSVVQNDELKTRHAVMLSAKIPTALFSNIVKNVSKKQIKEWAREY